MKHTNLLHWMAGIASFTLFGCEQSVNATQDDDVADGDGDGDGDGTETETGDGDGDDESTSESGGFVPDLEDDGGPPPCDPFMQDCPDGEKCVPYTESGSGVWDANKCVPVMGDGQVGDACTWGGIIAATDDCAADSVCWDVMDIDGQAIGVCTPFCEGTADSPVCAGGTSCLIANEGSITLCIETCDPLLQDCADGLGCFWAVGEFNCIFTSDLIPTGEPCGYINDCAPGNLCADAATLPECNGSACCASYCDLLDPTCTAAGTDCTTFFEEGTAPPGYEDIGVCILPG